jgi:excinuclease UvrABC ATPase subunit
LPETADHLVDLRPESEHIAGLIATGPPQEVAACKAPHTGGGLAALRASPHG